MNKDTRLLMVTIYLFLMAAFLYVQPGFVFGQDGRVRPFGVSEKESTIFPLWYCIFVVAVISYCLTLVLSKAME